MNIFLNVENDGVLAQHEVGYSVSIKELAKLVTDGTYKRMKLIFDGKDLLEEYPDCEIQDTDLYNLAEISVEKIDLEKIFIDEDRYVFISLDDKRTAFLRSESSVFHILQSFRLYCTCIIPFSIVNERYLHDFDLVSNEIRMRHKHIEGCYLRFHYNIKYSDAEKFINDDPPQIQSDLFVHDHVFEEKIFTEDFFDLMVSELIDQLIVSTGSVMAGSYVLGQFIEGIEPGDVDIFSYSLSFLRLFINSLFRQGQQPKVTFNRHEGLDSYKIELENGNYLNFVHIGQEDLYLSADDNRSKTIEFILEDFDIMACATCYDGERVYMNRLTLEKKSYIRLTNLERHGKYEARGIEFIPIPDVKMTLLTERHGYSKPITKITKSMTLNIVNQTESHQLKISEWDLLSDIYDEVFPDPIQVLMFGDKIIPNVNIKLKDTSITDGSIIHVS